MTQTDSADVEQVLDELIDRLGKAQDKRAARGVLIEARRLRNLTARWSAIPPPEDARREMLSKVMSLVAQAGGPAPPHRPPTVSGAHAAIRKALPTPLPGDVEAVRPGESEQRGSMPSYPAPIRPPDAEPIRPGGQASSGDRASPSGAPPPGKSGSAAPYHPPIRPPEKSPSVIPKPPRPAGVSADSSLISQTGSGSSSGPGPGGASPSAPPKAPTFSSSAAARPLREGNAPSVPPRGPSAPSAPPPRGGRSAPPPLRRRSSAAMHAVSGASSPSTSSSTSRASSSSASSSSSAAVAEPIELDEAASAALLRPSRDSKAPPPAAADSKPPPARASSTSLAGRALRTQLARGITLVRPDAAPWRPYPSASGVTVKLLYRQPQTGQYTALLKVGAGASLPAHRHAGVEEMYVVEGVALVGDCELCAGDYCRSEPGSVHRPIRTAIGCVLLLHGSERDELLDADPGPEGDA